MNAFIYMLRREIWEHRAFVVVPLVLATMFAVGHFFLLAKTVSIGTDSYLNHGIADFIDEWAWADQDDRKSIMGMVMSAWFIPFLITLGVMTIFYLLDALFSDRKDRSILFWKSLPITDTATVLSKVMTAAIVAPLITIGWVFALHISLLLMFSVVVWGYGASAWDLVWAPMPFLDIYLFYAYVVIAAALWFAPVWGWLLLASAWARRAVFLWATLPILALVLSELYLFETTRVWSMVIYRISWGFGIHAFNRDIPFDISMGGYGQETLDVQGSILSLPAPQQFFSSIDMYQGLITAALFIGGAIWLRRYRDEI